MILLIYGMTNEPATLILQGNDGQMCFVLESNSLHPIDPVMYSSIDQALQPK